MRTILWSVGTVVAICALAIASAVAARSAVASPRYGTTLVGTNASGNLRCLGASTVQPLLVRWAHAYHLHNPQADVEVGNSTRFSAGGVKATLAGRANCVSFAREPFPSEIAAFRQHAGRAPIVVPVARGSYATPHGTFALAIYVNRANPLRGLTLAQLAAVLSGNSMPDRQRSMERWGQLGLRGTWASRPIHVYGMTPERATGNPPGIVNYLDQRVLHERPWRSDLRVESDSPSASALTSIVQQVGKDPDGIGFSGFGYATSAVRAVPIAAEKGGPYVQGTVTTVADGTYPLARTVYLGFPRSTDGRISPIACSFTAYILGTEGQKQVAGGRMRFFPLPPNEDRHASELLAHACRAPSATATTAVHGSSVARYLDARGAVRIVGYNDMYWMLKAIDRRFVHIHPETRFALTLTGTRTAPPALADGTSLLAPMGAPFSEAELTAYRRRTGTDPLGFRVAHASLNPGARSGRVATVVEI